MPHMLAVSAGQVCDPILVLVLMKANDRLWLAFFNPAVFHSAISLIASCLLATDKDSPVIL